MQVPGCLKITALPALHAISGKDVTGSFANKGKATWWKVFKDTSEETITSLSKLGTRGPPPTDYMDAIKRLVCHLFSPGTKISSAKELRWVLFTKKQAQSERLPPTPPPPTHTHKRHLDKPS